MGRPVVPGARHGRGRPSRTRAAVLGFLFATPDLPLWLLMTLAAMMGVGAAFVRPAFGALIPSLVPPESIPAANALRSAALQFSAVIGPALGGILLAVHGADSVLLLKRGDLLGEHPRAPRRKGPSTGAVAVAQRMVETRAGFGEVRFRPWMLVIMMLGSVHALVVIGPLLFLLPELLREGGRFTSYGPLIALQAFGALAGGMVAARWTPRNAGASVICAQAAAGSSSPAWHTPRPCR
ncbi:MFS transporter [Streptomyces sp. NPDC127092]|uniref:MFS transporter n=1 Tax=Streptomyces sp. NPDC127092 TaxID=3347135 RepID=UPI00365F1BF0